VIVEKNVTVRLQDEDTEKKYDFREKDPLDAGMLYRPDDFKKSAQH
jgi:hypothetical protein